LKNINIQIPIVLKSDVCEEFVKITDVTPIVVSDDKDEAMMLTELIVPVIIFDQPRSQEYESV
jgi:hypothetical protein